MKSDDFMVDLETLGTRENSVIIAIGAVQFGPEGLGSELYVTINPSSCVEAGLEMDVSTVMWWMKQSDEARSAFDRPGCELNGALHYFLAYLFGLSSQPKIWGNGATFDNVILRNAFNAARVDVPWPYYNDKCYRTLKGLTPGLKYEKVGVAHNALDDAKSQALHAIKVFRKLGIYDA